ncbi:MAG: hypothetical protein ACUVT6_12230, partial [Thermodesulfobacteriota bacterium]
LPGQIRKIPQLQKPRIEKPVIRPLKPGWKAKMLAATVEGRVHLKWIIEEGWLPPRGFNLYRKKEGEKEYQKLAGPFLEREELPDIESFDLSGRKTKYSLIEFQKLARKSIPPEKGKLWLPAEKVPSSAPLFKQLGDYKRKEFSPILWERRPNFEKVKLSEFKELSLYYQRLGLNLETINLARKLKAAPPKKTIDETAKVINARALLSLNSLLNSTIAQALGLAYVDKDVTASEKYDYELRMINDDGSESPLASTSIKVGFDPLPSPPRGFMAAQLGVKRVGLRWEPDEREDSAQVIAYELYRISGSTKTKLTLKPHVIGQIEDNQGQLMDRITYLNDDNAPLGEVEYQLYGLDAFGRRSEPAVVRLSVEDWEKPNPVENVKVRIEGEAAIINWVPSLGLGGTIDPDAVYFIYRMDTEEDKPEWVKLNKAPLQLRPEKPKEEKRGPKLDLEKEKGITFRDTTIQKDHIYRYCITALYVKNNLESNPSPEVVLGVPDYKTPLAPQNLSSQFQTKKRTAKEAAFDIRWSGRLNIPVSPVELPTVKTAEGKKLGEKRMAESGPYGRPYFKELDIGGTVTLSWEPVPLKNPVKYKIYRSLASGYLTMPTVEERKLMAPLKNWKIKETVMGKAPALVSQEKVYKYFSYRSPEDTPPGDWTLLDEIETTRFDDVLPKSRPVYYNYLVRAVSRWGVEGEPSFVSIRVPATMRPSPPELVNLTATLDQGMLLTWKPLPPQEEIAKYVVYRKMLGDLAEKDLAAALLPSAGTAPSASSKAKPQEGLKVSQPKISADFKLRTEIMKRIQDYGVAGEVIPGSRNMNKEGNFFFKDQNVLPEAEYAYFVVAIDRDGWTSEASAPLTAVSLRTKAEPVVNLKAQYRDGKVILMWLPPAVRGSHYITVYIVERGRGDSDKFITLAMGLKEARYTDDTAMPGKKYVYKVIAVDERGNRSEPVSVTMEIKE